MLRMIPTIMVSINTKGSSHECVKISKINKTNGTMIMVIEKISDLTAL